ncbi:ABC transporter substrate-binding protein [Chloroflexota bacterium]
MRKGVWKLVLSCSLVLALLAIPAVGCGDDDGGNGKVVITIGEMNDLSGPASPACIGPHRALGDLIEYYNENEFIPGVELKHIFYDTKYDASREIPGYEWLKERGADAIVAVLYSSAEYTKPFAEEDGIPVFALSSSPPLLEPPFGWTFSIQAPPTEEIITVLQHISDNWTDYPTKPKIGWIGVVTGFASQQEAVVEEYCLANPDKFDWVGAYSTPLSTMSFSGEIAKLKGCDWIGLGLVPTAMAAFVSQLRGQGSEAMLFSQEFLLACWGMVVDAVGYEAIDGSLACGLAGWWSDPFPIVEEARARLYEKYPAEAEKIIHEGVGYVGATAMSTFFLEIIRAAVEEVGAENFDGQALYNTARNFSYTFVDFPEWSYSPTRNYPQSDIIIYEVKAAEEDAIAITGWIPMLPLP